MREILLAVTLFSMLLNAQFTRTNTIMDNESPTVALFADFDNDDDLDLFISSTTPTGPETKIIRNDNGTFSNNIAVLSNSLVYAAKAGDFENDGDIDLLVSFSEWNGTANGIKIFINVSGTYTLHETGISSSKVLDWGDLDNDGDLDVVKYDEVYENIEDLYTLGCKLDGLDWIGIYNGDINKCEIFDDDGDGDLDVILSSDRLSDMDLIYTNYFSMSLLYRNKGEIDDIVIEYPSGFMGGSHLALGDMDNDSILEHMSLYTEYYNETSADTSATVNLVGSTADISEVLPYNCGIWGDLDNDGDLDFTATGFDDQHYGRYSSNAYAYINNNTALNSMQTLSAIVNGECFLGDFDNDSDLDIMLYKDSLYAYENTCSIANTPPNPPTNLSVYISEYNAILSWDRATDTETPSDGLSYNIYIRSEAGQCDIVSPMSNVTNGYRKIVGTGNVGQLNSYAIKDLAPGTYYWSVQTIDHSYAGSEFAAEQTFEIIGIPVPDVPVALDATVITNERFTANWSASANATGYILDVAADSLFSNYITGYENYDSGDTFSKTITGLTAGTDHYYRICAYNSVHTSGYSDTIVVSTLSNDSIYPPIALEATNITWSGFRANWINTCGAEGFWLDIARDSIFTDYIFHDLGLGSEEYYDITGLDPDSDYYYRLRSLLDYNVSDYSNVIKVHTLINTVGHSFTETASLSFSYPADWGDFDNDGDLDILSGKDIYRNDSGSFTLISSVTPYSGISHWGDFDNDGDLDILANNKLYKNENGNFSYYKVFDYYYNVHTSGSNISGYECRTDFVDINSDGLIDIFLTGQYSFEPDPYDPYFELTDYISYFYYNDGNGGFKKSESKAPISSYFQNFTWGDYDNDGDPDLFITAVKSGGPSWGEFDFWDWTGLYRNDLSNGFTLMNDDFPDLINGSADFGDYDNDGYSDIVLCGDTSSGPVLQIHRNNQDGTFSDINAGLPGFENSSVEWGDFDNDGYLDLLVKGLCDSQNATKVFRNVNGVFSLFDENFSYSSANGCSWGDYDNDGDIDLITGSVLYNNVTDSAKINLIKSANTPPAAPTDLSSSVNSASVSFTWNKASDNETPQDGLSYNIYIGNSSLSGDELSPMSDTENGYRRIVEVGNAGQKLSKIVRSLPNGTYYWSVQAIDNGYAGSEFGTEQSFIINVLPPPPPVAYTASVITTTSFRANWYNSSGATGYYLSISTDSLFSTYLTGYNNKNVGNVLNHSITGLNNNSAYYFKVKSYNTAGVSDYGNVKKVMTNELYPPATQSATIIKDNSFTANWSSVSEATGYYLDVASDSLFTQYVTGFQNKNVGNNLNSNVTGLTPDTYYYYRLRSYNSGGTSGNGSFMLVLTEFSDILANTSGALARADFNNDGFMDFVVIGTLSRIYMNNADGSFTVHDPGFESFIANSIDLGDYNNDGNIDIVTGGYTGSHPNYTPVFKIYRNEGSNTFTDESIDLDYTGFTSQVEWGDYNIDGKPDVLVSGKLYRNDGDGVFTYVSTAISDNYYLGKTYWFDFTNDGYPDVISSEGMSYYQGDEKMVLYRNNCDGTFTQVSTGIAGVEASSISFGDYNNDGYADMLVTGNKDSYIQDSDDNFGIYALTYTQLYRNNGNGTFSDASNSIIDISGSGIFADYDNDGQLDIIVSGNHSVVTLVEGWDVNGYPITFWNVSYTKEAKIYKGNGNGGFTDLQVDYLDGHSGKISVCDNDNDGKPEMLFSGYDGTGYYTKVYEYDVTPVNSSPTEPSNLSAVQAYDNSLTFSWDKATDAETPQNGLSYNFYIGSQADSCDIVSPMSEITTGYRRIVGLGNAQQNTSWTIKDLAPGTYYWSVQAIDHSFAGSPFAPEQTITVTGIEDELIPLVTKLYQNYPNPFNPVTEIRFSLAEDAKVNLSVYNTNGQLVRTLIDGKTEKGYHTVNFDASELNSGMYLYKLDVNGKVQTKKMLMLK